MIKFTYFLLMQTVNKPIFLYKNIFSTLKGKNFSKKTNKVQN